MPLATAGIVKLGDNVMPLAVATVVANNIMPLAAAAPLAAASNFPGMLIACGLFVTLCK